MFRANKLLLMLLLVLVDMPLPASAYVLGGGGAASTGCPGTTWASLTGTPPAGMTCYISNAASCVNGTQVTASGSTPCTLTFVNGGWYPSGGATSAGGPPSGSATGQLTGSYPAPSVNAWVNEFHTSDYGVPTPPANALPKLTTATGARTGTIANGSNSLTLSGTSSIAAGNWVAVDKAGSPCATNWRATAGGNATYASTCVTTGFTTETAVPQGTTGATTVHYELCDIDGYGGVGECDAPFATTTANATQSFNNWNLISWNWASNQVPEAEVCRSFAGTYKPIGITLNSFFADVGQAAIANDPDLPNCPGSASSAQQQPENLMAKVTAYNSGTHVATLSVNAANGNCASGGCAVWSDDGPLINSAINAAETASTQLVSGAAEGDSTELVDVDPGYYTVGGQIMTGESFGTIAIRGAGGASITSQNISGPLVVLDGSGCDSPPSNCNRTARAWFTGFKLLGQGSSGTPATNYPDESAIFIGNNNGTYINDISANDFMTTWNAVIWGNAAGLTNDESGESTSWTHVYLTNIRMYIAGGAWIQLGLFNTGDDVHMSNLFLKSSNQGISGSMGGSFAPFYVSEFDPTISVMRIQIPSNALNVEHIANTQRGLIDGVYIQTASAITGAFLVLDNDVGFVVSNNLFNMTSVSGIPAAIAFENTSSNDTIISPSVYHSSSMTNSIDFSQDGSSCQNNTLIGGFANANTGSIPAVTDVDVTDVLPLKASKTLSGATGSITTPLANTHSVCQCTAAHACTVTPSAGSLALTGTSGDVVTVSCQ